jgi:hypothetical protein
MKEYRVTMYAPDQDKFHFTVTADSKQDAEALALKRIIVVNIEKIKNEQ